MGLIDAVNPPLSPHDFEQSHFKSVSKNTTHAGVIFDATFGKREKWQIERETKGLCRQTCAKIIVLSSMWTGQKSTLSNDSWGQGKSS